MDGGTAKRPSLFLRELRSKSISSYQKGSGVFMLGFRPWGNDGIPYSRLRDVFPCTYDKKEGGKQGSDSAQGNDGILYNIISLTPFTYIVMHVILDWRQIGARKDYSGAGKRWHPVELSPGEWCLFAYEHGQVLDAGQRWHPVVY